MPDARYPVFFTASSVLYYQQCSLLPLTGLPLVRIHFASEASKYVKLNGVKHNEGEPTAYSGDVDRVFWVMPITQTGHGDHQSGERWLDKKS
jgi:hypothetical protein